LLCVYNPALVNALSEGMVCEVIKLNDLIWTLYENNAERNVKRKVVCIQLTFFTFVNSWKIFGFNTKN
jgi:hypothetical protein